MSFLFKCKEANSINRVLYLIFIVVFLFGCGEFIRDNSNNDIKIFPDSNFDKIEYIDKDSYIQDNEIYENLFDIGLNESPTEFVVEDVFHYTEDIIPTDIEDTTIDNDIISQDTDTPISNDSSNSSDEQPEDSTFDTKEADTSPEQFSDTGIQCDCDTGFECGICYYPGTEGLSDKLLKDKLYQFIKDHLSLGYSLARKKMFAEIDNNNGWVECVYTGFKIQTDTIPDPNIMNTEHTWPQSMGASDEPAKSDLFHLFPTRSDANSKRANYPFGTVTKIIWSDGGSKLGTNTKGVTVFEPRDEHKGNAARAMFYFSIRYRLPIDDEQESELKNWHKIDPVDENEINRCNKIFYYQKNRNPFVDYPPFVDRIADF